MDVPRCPNCGEPTVIAGTISGDGRCRFDPRHTRSLRLKQGIYLPGPSSACFSCGHTWTRLPPQELRDFIKRYGREVLKQHLESSVGGPKDGGLDDPDARQAAEKVAEIDALVLEGKQAEATRRYRELTGSTWDQAVGAARDWADLERGTKLGLFGWRPKEVPRGEGGEGADHPMRDRWLDG